MMTAEPFSLPAFTMAEYNLYRLDDRVFWAFLLAGLIFCLIHAARRAFRQPRVEDYPEKEGSIPISGGEKIERHTLFQRVFHWSNTVAVIILTISGWMVYQPRAILSFTETTSIGFTWHRWGTALLLIGLASHFIYESFIAHGSNPVAVNRAEGKILLAILKNFFGLSKSYPLINKYHPGQIVFHWIVAGNLFLLILSGFVIWKPFRDLLPLSLFGLGWDFVFYCRLLHGFFSATLIPSLMGHIYFAVLIKKNWSETKSMFTGRVSLREYLNFHSVSD